MQSQQTYPKKEIKCPVKCPALTSFPAAGTWILFAGFSALADCKKYISVIFRRTLPFQNITYGSKPYNHNIISPYSDRHSDKKGQYQEWYCPFYFSTQDTLKIRNRPQLEPGSDYYYLMRVAGLEPARSCLREILSLLCLPIPPYPHMQQLLY